MLPQSATPFLSRTATVQEPLGLFMARMNRRNDRGPPTREVRPVMNDGIKQLELRVVAPVAGGKDEILGLMSREDALKKAKEMGGLDLILVNSNSDPPVCKIVDYSKYRYMQLKKAKEVKKNSKTVEVKEIKMSYKIDVHDYQVRKKNAAKFLLQGNRVKCTVMFRGREVQHDKLGFELLDKLTEDLSGNAVRESPPKREGRNLALLLSPRADVMKRISDERRAEERSKKKEKKQELEDRAAAKAAGLTVEDEDEDDDDFDLDLTEDDDDDDDVDMGDSLDALLGSKDEVTKGLFS